MGKLGGRELNYASDVDVIFVHREAGAPAMQRAGRAAAAVIDLLSAPGPEGIALRVDPDLRPEGRAGTLSRSLEGMADYYEQHAATWERQALLKARYVAGDAAVGAAFLERVTPLVFPSVLPAGAVEDVRASKARIEEHVRAAGKEDVELKRGRGGIRDVEFAVQLLQLVHGGRDERLREPNTLRALTALADEGFVRRADADVLADSYRFLRRLEHRLQMVRDLQTHELPRDPAAQLTLARSMGLPDAAALLDEYAKTTDVVRGLHERLFYRPLVEALATAAPSPGVDRASTEELLAALGFADPAAAYALLTRVADPATRLGKVIDTLFPVIGPALAAATPDAALVRFARVAEQHRDDDDVADALAERPDAARRLAALTGASSAFSDSLVARPALVRSLYHPPLPEHPLFLDDPDGELLRVAGAYAAGEVAIADLGGLLAGVAEGVIERAVSESASEVPLAVIGMGRLGAEELSFALRPRRAVRLRRRGCGCLPRGRPRGRARHGIGPRAGLVDRRRPPARGEGWPAGALARLAPRVLGTLGADVGVPVAAPRAVRRRRRGARPAVRRERARLRVPRGADPRPDRRDPADARAHGRGTRAPQGSRPVSLQARVRRPGRRAVRRRARAHARWRGPPGRPAHEDG